MDRTNMLVAALQVVLALLFTVTGASKIIPFRNSENVRGQLGVPRRLWPVIGGLEWLAVVGLLAGFAWTPTAAAASAGILLLMVGAFASRARVRHQSRQLGLMVIDGIVFALALGLCLLCLREPS